jgi:hypothetical protein
MSAMSAAHSEYTVACAYTTVKTRRDADVRMEVPCDGIVLWVSDESFFADGAVTGDFDIDIDLREPKPSWPRFILHASNFSLPIADEDRRPHETIIWEI